MSVRLGHTEARHKGLVSAVSAGADGAAGRWGWGRGRGRGLGRGGGLRVPRCSRRGSVVGYGNRGLRSLSLNRDLSSDAVCTTTVSVVYLILTKNTTYLAQNQR